MKKTIAALLVLTLLLSVSACKKANQDADPDVSSDVVLYEKHGFKVSYTGFQKGDKHGDFFESVDKYGLKIENNTGKDSLISLTRTYANGYMLDMMFYIVDKDDRKIEESSFILAKGKKMNTAIFIEDFFANESGVDTLTDIHFTLTLSDPETGKVYFNTKDLQITTENTDYEQSYDESGTLAYFSDDIKIVVQGREPGAPQLLRIYCLNDSEKDICILCREATVNGEKKEPYFSTEIAAGSRSVGTLGFDPEVGVIHDIGLIFEILPYDFSTGTVVNKTLSVSDEVTISF